MLPRSRPPTFNAETKQPNKCSLTKLETHVLLLEATKLEDRELNALIANLQREAAARRLQSQEYARQVQQSLPTWLVLPRPSSTATPVSQPNASSTPQQTPPMEDGNSPIAPPSGPAGQQYEPASPAHQRPRKRRRLSLHELDVDLPPPYTMQPPHPPQTFDW
jgi:hypothetical protein